MRLYTVRSEGLAHNSYMLVDGEEAAVVDPRRDCQVYINIAKKNCTKIRYIFETHRNEDYVVGSKELKSLAGAQVYRGKQLTTPYADHNLDDQESIKIRSLKIKTVHTPGHTDDSVCYAVSNTDKSSQPLMVFTGDTLFVNSVGRTDLQGKDAQTRQTEKLYDSLHEKLLPLGDNVLVYPAHGAGTVCGSDVGEQPYSTLGYECRTNPFLKLSKQEFLQRILAQEMIIPAYFRKMEEYNTHGAPPLHGFPDAKSLSVSEFENEMNEEDSTVVDTRMPYAFSGSHIPGALSIWLGGGTAVYSGWILSYEQRILLVVERRGDVKRVTRHFWRLGLDNLYGVLCKGMNEWQEQGKPIRHVHTLSVSDLKDRRAHYEVIDVREPSEWHGEGIIEGAEQIFFADLPKKAELLDRNKRIAVTCSVGNRSSLAASILDQKGFGHISNILGGMTAWRKMGYETVKSK